jgi:hypothetical protein
MTAWRPLRDLRGLKSFRPSTREAPSGGSSASAFRPATGPAAAAAAPRCWSPAYRRMCRPSSPRGSDGPGQARDPELWADFAKLPGSARQRAERRLRLALEVERLVAAGASRSQAVERAAQDASLTARAVWRVLQCLNGVGRANWLPALATTSGGLPAVEPAWGRPLLKLYRAPQKPSLADALARLPETLPPGATAPSYGQAKRYLKRMSAVERARGRLGPNALKGVKAFTRRAVDGLRAGDVFIADGHSGDFEVMHPSGGQPCRPELTCVLDVATRLWVGWSAALAESTWAVSDALRDAIERHGVARDLLRRPRPRP